MTPMPRIRSIKPDHRTHRKIGVFTDSEYRLWVSMINEADDEGRFVADAAQLRVQTWPYHPKVTNAMVERAIVTIASLGRIKLYVVDDVRYGVFPAWKDHQHPKYPTPSKLPPPPASNERFLQSSPSSPPGLTPERRGVESSRDESSRAELIGEERVLGGGEPTNARRLPAPSSNDRKRTAPTRGTWNDTLAEVKLQHPELSDAEQQDLAMKHYGQALR